MTSGQIASDIRNGQINNFLSKPVDYLAYRVTLFLSSRLLYTLITIVPVAAVFFWFRGFITLPESWTTWPLFVVSLVMAGLSSFSSPTPSPCWLFGFWRSRRSSSSSIPSSTS